MHSARTAGVPPGPPLRTSKRPRSRSICSHRCEVNLIKCYLTTSSNLPPTPVNRLLCCSGSASFLPTRSKNDRLKTWANKELSGYGDEDELPNYRVVSATATGHFSGWGGSQATLPIPPAALEKNHQRFATQVHLVQAIATYEDLVKTATTDGQITVGWPPNLVLYYQSRIPFTGQQLNLIAAYQEIPKPTLVEVLDTVRNRVLNVALEIQSELGERDEDLRNITPQSEEKIERYVAQQIFNGNVYVSTGQSTMTVQEQHIAAGNWEQLQRVLCNSGVSQSDLESLSIAVIEDKKTMGTAVEGWSSSRTQHPTHQPHPHKHRGNRNCFRIAGYPPGTPLRPGKRSISRLSKTYPTSTRDLASTGVERIRKTFAHRNPR